MQNLHQDAYIKAKVNPYISFISLFFFVLAGYFIGPFVALGLIKILYRSEMVSKMLQLQANMELVISDEQTKVPILILQAITSIFTFILFPIFFLYFIERKKINNLLGKSVKDFKPVLLTLLVVFFFMMVNSLIIQWNANINLPSFMAEFERFAQQTENSAKLLTEFFTQFHSLGYFLMVFVVVAVIAAVGEELVFRGLMQNYLVQATKNAHVGIWVAAFIFSLFHFQFYGLIPRMLLGVLFGYLYLWSGNLVYPIIAHMFNNGFMIIVLYLHQQQTIEYDIDANKSIPLLPWIISLILAVWLLVIFRRYFVKKAIIDG